jgi:hypothetical protein
MKNTEIKFKTMPSPKNLKLFILDRINHINKDTKIRLIKYDKTGAIYALKSGNLDRMQFCPSFAKVQSIDFINKEVIYTIWNDTHGYWSILSEIDYFNRNPDEAMKRNFKLIK